MVPIELYITVFAVMVVLVFISLKATGISGIFTSMLSVMLAFVLAAVSVNGTLQDNVGGLDGSGNIIQGVTVIEIPALSYICVFIGVFMLVVFISHVLNEIKWRNSRDTIELDI